MISVQDLPQQRPLHELRWCCSTAAKLQQTFSTVKGRTTHSDMLQSTKWVVVRSKPSAIIVLMCQATEVANEEWWGRWDQTKAPLPPYQRLMPATFSRLFKLLSETWSAISMKIPEPRHLAWLSDGWSYGTCILNIQILKTYKQLGKCKDSYSLHIFAQTLSEMSGFLWNKLMSGHS